MREHDINEAINIYPYINSRTIREYLKKIEYKFDPMLCAYLVWQSERHTMKEKHEAWKQIIRSMPDMPVPEKMNCVGWDSLHRMLKDYMKMQDWLVAELEKDDGAGVYRYEIKETRTHRIVGEEDFGRSDFLWLDGDLYARNFQTCKAQALTDAKEYGERVRINKHYLGVQKNRCSISATYRKDGEIIDVDYCGLPDETEMGPIREGIPCIPNAYSDVCWGSFEGFWYDIPIPFQKGDVVHDPHCSSRSWGREPFVLMGTTPWFKKQQAEKSGKPMNPRFGDSSDMRAYGYSFDSKFGFLYDDSDAWYLNLEYYKAPLKGRERLVGAYSKFVKEEIDGWTLMKLKDLYQSEYEAEILKKELGFLNYKDDYKCLLDGEVATFFP